MNHGSHGVHGKLLFADDSFQIRGAAFEVYRAMGSGFLEAVRELAPEHRAQTINYLRATGLRLGLLINLGAAREVQIERFAL